MIVQIRKSGGDECEMCGATELVTLPDGSPLERDVLAFLEARNAELERDCVARFERAATDLRADALEHVEEKVAQYRASLLTFFREENAALADGVLELLEPDARKVRVWKRRWQRQIAAEVAVTVDDLRAKTRLV